MKILDLRDLPDAELEALVRCLLRELEVRDYRARMRWRAHRLVEQQPENRAVRAEKDDTRP